MQEDKKINNQTDEYRHKEIELFELKSKISQQNKNIEFFNNLSNNEKPEKDKNNLVFKFGVAALLAVAIAGSGFYFNYLMQQQQEHVDPDEINMIKNENNIVFSNETKEFIFNSGAGLFDAALAVEGHEKVDLNYIVERIKLLNNLPQVIKEGDEIVIPASVDTTTSDVEAYDPSRILANNIN